VGTVYDYENIIVPYFNWVQPFGLETQVRYFLAPVILVWSDKKGSCLNLNSLLKFLV
jgi:hypothetical protein